jgi:hypothetical protein
MSRASRRSRRRAAAALGASFGAGALGYAAYVVKTWHAYGRQRNDRTSAPGDLLDGFMPDYEIDERHAVEVAAPAAVTFAAARAMDVNRAPLVRAIFALRSLPAQFLGRRVHRVPRPLVDETLALGWRMLADVPERALVMGAYTQPWTADVEFHGLPPARFAAFADPGYAKIVWTLEAEPLGEARSRFVTRTRVQTTDPASRRRFRRYWAFLSPGILLIRRASLGIVKRDAERRFSALRRAPD